MGNGNAPTLQSMCFCEENCRQTYTDWTAVSPETTETGVADLFYTVLFNGVRFDVYFEDDLLTVYDIEMQTYHDSDLPKRFRYYQGMIDLNMMEHSAKFGELKNSYIVFICLENPYKIAGRHKYTICNMCEEDPTIEFDDGAYQIILSSEGDKDDVSEEMKAFLRYLTTKEVGSDFTRRLDERVGTARRHEK